MRGGIIIIFLISLITVANAQRSHVLELRGGYYTNFGVSFYDYYDPDSARQNFEWDQHFNSEYLGIAWRFPINAYLELGLGYNHSITAKSEIIEAESLYYGYDDVPVVGASGELLYAGTTVLKSRYQEFLVNLRINHLIRSEKVQFYLVFSHGFIVADNLHDAQNIFQTADSDLRSDLEGTYIRRDYRGTFSYGFGLDYPLRNGVKINLIDARGTVIKDYEESKILISKYGINVSTGISYHFRRRR